MPQPVLGPVISEVEERARGELIRELGLDGAGETVRGIVVEVEERVEVSLVEVEDEAAESEGRRPRQRSRLKDAAGGVRCRGCIAGGARHQEAWKVRAPMTRAKAG